MNHERLRHFSLTRIVEFSFPAALSVWCNFPFKLFCFDLGHITGRQWSENTVEVVMEVEETEWAEDYRPVAMSGHQSPISTVISDCILM
jgi:hypothetical protein